jgi:hypothetical protein
LKIQLLAATWISAPECVPGRQLKQATYTVTERTEIVCDIINGQALLLCKVLCPVNECFVNLVVNP